MVQYSAVAFVGGIDLELAEPRVVGGAIFSDLGQPGAVMSAGPHRTIDIDGHRVRLFPDATAVSLLSGSPKPDDIAASCLELAQRGLDLAAATGASAQSLPEAADQHIVWWRASTGAILRVVIARPLHVFVSAAGGVVDAHGHVQPLPSLPAATWNPSMRFFRLSQLADDVFEAYRNAFLALEAVLDATVSSGTATGEKAWLKFALRDVPRTYGLDLHRYLSHSKAVQDPVDQFMQEQWTARRCAVFHAKTTAKGSLLPGVPSDRRKVADALEPILRLVIDLNRAAFNAIFPGGGMTVDGFDMAIKNLLAHRYSIAVTSTTADCDSLTADQLSQSPHHVMAVSHLGRLDSVGREHGLLAEEDVSNLSLQEFSTVVSYTAVQPPLSPLTIHAPSGLLSCHRLPVVDLAGLDRLQVLIRWVLDNRQMPKSRFTL